MPAAPRSRAAARPSPSAASRARSPRGDEHRRLSRARQLADLAADLAQDVTPHIAALVRDQGGAQLHDRSAARLILRNAGIEGERDVGRSRARRRPRSPRPRGASRPPSPSGAPRCTRARPGSRGRGARPAARRRLPVIRNECSTCARRPAVTVDRRPVHGVLGTLARRAGDPPSGPREPRRRSRHARRSPTPVTVEHGDHRMVGSRSRQSANTASTPAGRPGRLVEHDEVRPSSSPAP